MTDILPWAATAATITAAFMTAANLGARVTGYGFAVFLVGSLCWLTIGATTAQPALLWTNAVLTALNIFGMWRWLGRQAKMEEGTEAASKASEADPGETLFPASLLTGGKVVGAQGPVGAAMDAMVGADSGRIAYVGVSDGGVGGIGETLRRIDWKDLRPDGGHLRLAIGPDQFNQAPQFEKDSWPER